MLIKGGLVVGKTENYEDILIEGPGARGIVGPRWDYLTIRDTKFYNLVSWKNLRAGVIAEEMGAVEWHNFKTADNV